jgi:two-component sensor histidine kinase/Tfp pilus assembly protein PilF
LHADCRVVHACLQNRPANYSWLGGFSLLQHCFVKSRFQTDIYTYFPIANPSIPFSALRFVPLYCTRLILKRSKQKGATLLLLVLFLATTNVTGQSQRTETDNIVEELHSKAWDFWDSGDLDSAQHYISLGIQQGKALNDSVTLPYLFSDLGMIHFQLGRYQSSIFCFDTAISTLPLYGTEEELARAYLNRGIVYNAQSHYELAIQDLLFAVAVFEKYHLSTEVASTYNSLGIFHKNLKQYDVALNYLQAGLQLRDSLQLNYWMAGSLNNIGTVHKLQGNYEQAQIDFNNALQNLTDDKASNLYSSVRANMGEVFLLQGDISKALATYQIALQQKLIEPIHFEGVAELLNEIANIYSLTGQLDSAAFLADSALHMAGQLNDSDLLLRNYEIQKAISSAKNRLDSALYWGDRHAALKDSMLNERSQKIIHNLQIKYESEKKQLANIALAHKVKLAALTIEKKDEWLFMVIAVLLLVAITLAVVYYNYRLKRREKEQAELYLDDMHHRVKNNLQILSGLLSIKSKYVEDDAAKALLTESENRVHTLTLIHQHLYHKNKNFDINKYVDSLCYGVLASYGLDEDVKLVIEIEVDQILPDDVIPLGMVLNESVSNACKHAFDDTISFPQINVTVREIGNKYSLLIADNGVGSAEPGEGERKRSFGMQLCTNLARERKGSYRIDSSEQGLSIHFEITKSNRRK